MQQAQNARADDVKQAGDVLLLELRGGVEDSGSEGTRGGVNAVQQERVEVDVQIERRAKALHDIHSSRSSARNTLALEPRAVEGEDRAQE